MLIKTNGAQQRDKEWKKKHNIFKNTNNQQLKKKEKKGTEQMIIKQDRV